MFFGANWHYASQGTDYFQADAAVSPLQHYWSLSVEEQFYFVWPWLMLLIFSVVGLINGTARHARAIVLVTIVLIVVSSFAWSLWETSAAPTWAYFSTFSRAWELGVGALLAVVAGLFRAIPALLRTALAWAGLVGIVVSALVVSDENGGFPAPWAALPVLSTALVIISGTGGRAPLTWPISNPVSSYIGDISYSLYLWHFPFIILLVPLFPEGSWTYYVVVLLLVFGTSVMSYHFVEDPARRWHPRRRRERNKRRDAPTSNRFVPLLGVGGVAFLTAGLAIWALVPTITAPTATVHVPLVELGATPQPTEAPSTLPPLQASRQEEIRTALAAREWPTSTDPSLELPAEEAYVPEWILDHCLDIDERNIDSCVYGNPGGAETVALIGDSTAISIMPLLREAHPDMRIQALTRGQCPAADVEVTRLGGGPFPECAAHRAWVNEWIATNQPAVVVLTDVGTTAERMTAEGDGSARLAAYNDGLSRTLSTLSGASGQVVVVQSPPIAENLETCRSPVTGPPSCIAEVTSGYVDWSSAITETIAAGRLPNVVDVPVLNWFCLDRSCPSFIAGVRTFAGGSHLTAPAARAATPLYLEAINGQ